MNESDYALGYRAGVEASRAECQRLAAQIAHVPAPNAAVPLHQLWCRLALLPNPGAALRPVPAGSTAKVAEEGIDGASGPASAAPSSPAPTERCPRCGSSDRRNMIGPFGPHGCEAYAHDDWHEPYWREPGAPYAHLSIPAPTENERGAKT